VGEVTLSDIAEELTPKIRRYSSSAILGSRRSPLPADEREENYRERADVNPK
jgi:hypothetical protein